MQKYLLPILIYPLLALLAGCDGGNPTFTIHPDDGDLPGTPSEIPVASRTVLVYMMADNSLGNIYGSDLADLDEMVAGAKGGVIGDGRLLVYYNRPNTDSGSAPQMLEITEHGRSVLKTYPGDPSIYSVDPDRIKQVMADMKALAPAQEYGLVLWSHANGWLGPSNPSDDRYRAFGEDRGYHITIQTLGKTLENEKFAFVYFDCCLMGNIETIYELRHISPIMVASPTELSIDGMPYDRNVSVMFDLSKSAEEAMVEAAQNTFKFYEDNENGYDDGCQIAVYRTDELEAFADVTRPIYEKLTEINKDATQVQCYNKPAYETQSYQHYTYDMDNLMELYASRDYPELLEQWRTQWRKVVAYGAATRNGIGSLYLYRYCGLGTFAMDDIADVTWRGYNTLKWWTDVVSCSPAFNPAPSADGQ